MKDKFLETLRSSIEYFINEVGVYETLHSLNYYLKKIDEDEKTIRSVKMSKPIIIDRHIVIDLIFLENENVCNKQEVVFYLEKNDDYFYYSNNINEKILLVDKDVFEKILGSSRLEYFQEIIQQLNKMFYNKIINTKINLEIKEEKLLQKAFEDTMKELFLKEDLEKELEAKDLTEKKVNKI